METDGLCELRRNLKRNESPETCRFRYNATFNMKHLTIALHILALVALQNAFTQETREKVLTRPFGRANVPTNFIAVKGVGWNGYYKIIEHDSQNCLSIEAAGQHDGARLVANHPFSGAASEIWKIESVPGMGISIKSHSELGAKAVSVNGGAQAVTTGAEVIMFGWVKDPTQIWLVQMSVPYWRLKVKHSMLYLSVNSSGQVVQAESSKSYHQNWDITSYTVPPKPPIPPEKPVQPGNSTVPPPQPRIEDAKAFISGFSDHTSVRGGNGSLYYSCIVQNNHPSRSIKCTVKFTFNNALGTQPFSKEYSPLLKPGEKVTVDSGTCAPLASQIYSGVLSASFQ
jgi:hypothetical protein